MIVISGVTSYLGKNFYQALQALQAQVVIVARSSSDLSAFSRNTNTTILTYNHLPTEIIESIPKETFLGSMYFEFAWNGVFGTERNQPEQVTVNIPLMLASVQLAHHLGAMHWLGIGSQAEYGNLDKTITEDEPCMPTTMYGKAKLAALQLTEQLCQNYGMHHSWLRLFSLYGPNDNHKWFIPYVIEQMKQNSPLDTTLAVQYWDYLYIEDAVNALLSIKADTPLGVCNLASGTSTQLKEIIEHIRQLLHSASVVNYGAVPYRPDQVMYMQADIQRLSRLTGWQPKFNIYQGLQKTIAIQTPQHI